MKEYERMIEFNRGHDCINFECVNGSDRCYPGKGGSHGVCGLEIRFVVKGEHGAVQFLLSTGWIPKRVEKDDIGLRYVESWGGKHGPYPIDLGYHSKKPIYGGQKPIDSSCRYCDGKPCYYDGSGLNSNDAMYALVNGGDQALWEFLEKYYRCVFNNEEYPTPAEYPFPTRKLQAA